MQLSASEEAGLKRIHTYAIGDDLHLQPALVYKSEFNVTGLRKGREDNRNRVLRRKTEASATGEIKRLIILTGIKS
jgi:hypothetical protein